MTLREATPDDIPQMHVVRLAVKENRLSDPALVTTDHYGDFLTLRGKGWVCEINGRIEAFAVADLKEENIWALFVHPDHEQRGIGRQLHDLMIDWYFLQGKEKVWLSTAPNTRAEQFYKRSGWIPTGNYGEKEMRFEMTAEEWRRAKAFNNKSAR